MDRLTNPDRWTEEEFASVENALQEAQQKEGRRFTPEESKKFFLELGMPEGVSNRLVERQASRMMRQQ